MDEEGFIDRNEECRILENMVEELDKGKGGAVVITGEAGMGKSTLIEWVIDKAGERGYDSFQGSCISRNGLEYYAFKEAFEDIASPNESIPSLPLGISIFSDGRSEEEIPLFDSERQNTLRESFEAISSMALETPMIIIIEELHWADKSTLLAFRYLSEHSRDHPIMLIASYRSDEAVGYHLLDETIHHLKQKGICKEIDLTSFDVDDTKDALHSLLGEEPPYWFARGLQSKTDGNPLFITETIKSMRSKGILIPEEGVYPDIGSYLDWPSTVKYIVERKMVKLDKKTKNLLKYASILGPSFPYNLLSDFVDMDEMEMLDYLDTAIEHGILEEMISTEGYRFTQQAVRDVLYESQFKGKKRLLHKRAAESIENIYYGDETPYGRLGEHYENAKIYDRSYENYVKAAETAEDNDEKIRFYKAALNVSNNTSMDAEEVKEEFGNLLLEHGEKLIEEGSEGDLFLEDAKVIFKDLGDEERHKKACRLLGEEQDNIYK